MLGNSSGAEKVHSLSGRRSESIGMGHIMRCIGLAQEFNKRGYRPFFVSASHSDKVADRLAYEGFDYVCSDSEIASTEDLEFLVRKCQERACNSVIVDGYGLDQIGWVGFVMRV